MKECSIATFTCSVENMVQMNSELSFGFALTMETRRYMMAEATCFLVLVAFPLRSLPVGTIHSESPSPVSAIARKSYLPKDGTIITIRMERSDILMGT